MSPRREPLMCSLARNASAVSEATRHMQIPTTEVNADRGVASIQRFEVSLVGTLAVMGFESRREG